MIGLLRRFFESGRYPLVSYSRFPCRMQGFVDRPRTITYHKTAFDGEGASGTIVVRSVAQDFRQTRAWAKKLGVPYAGQSLGVFASTVLEVLLSRRNRRYLVDAEKEALLVKQGRKCALCGDDLERPEFDHTIALCKGGTNSPDNFQALCTACHAEKSKSERNRTTLGYLESRFNKDVYDKYVLSPSPPCMVYQNPGAKEYACRDVPVKDHLAVDVIGSRRMALYHATSLPVFTPLDDIRAVGPDQGELPDLVYVDKPVDVSDLESLLAALPYHGPAWYHRSAIGYCLHTFRLEWPDLRYGIASSGRVSGESVREAMDAMSDAWEGVPLDGPRNDPRKRSINSMVGVWGTKPESARLSVSFSFHSQDLNTNLKPCKERRVETGVFDMPNLMMQTVIREVLNPGSYRPLYDLCLCTEHVRLAQCRQVLKDIYKLQRLPLSFMAVTVDGLIWQKPRKNSTAEKIREILGGMTLEHLPQLDDYVRTELRMPGPQQKRLRMAARYPITSHRRGPVRVVRVEHPKEKQHLRGEYDMHKCTRDWSFQPRDLSWRDVDLEQARKIVVAEGGSLLVRGIAGTGKSYFIREELIPALRLQGKRVTVVAKTHAAAAVVDGDTCDHFAWKHIREGGTSADVIWSTRSRCWNLGSSATSATPASAGHPSSGF